MANRKPSSASSRGGGRSGRASPRPGRAARPQDAVPKVDEMIVRETDRTVPVEPVKTGSEARHPIPEPALDHRRQIVGTDEPKRKARK